MVNLFISAFLFIGASKTSPKLIWISIDGFQSSVFEKGSYKFLEDVAKKGVHVHKLRPVFVSKTFPNHLSKATGLNVEDHGVIANSIMDKELGNIKTSNVDRRWWDPLNRTEPIWTIVEKNGGKAAVIYWPGSAVPFGDVYPTFYHEIYNDSCTVHCRISQVIDIVKNGTYDLVMVYLNDFDSESHKNGPDSISASQTMSLLDNTLKYFYDQIKDTVDFDKTSIMISGDHGMASISDDRSILASEFTKNLDEVKMVQDGPVGMFHCNYSQCDTLIKRLQSNKHVLFAGYKHDLPKEFHYSNHKRIPDVLAVMEEGWMIKFYNFSYGKGNHGYPWQWAESMNSKFIGFHGKFKQGVSIDVLENIHLFTISCYILNVEDKCHNKKSLPDNILILSNLRAILAPIIGLIGVIIIVIALGVFMHVKKI